MLVTITDVISCENPGCREFARIIPGTHGLRSYYCPICGSVSYARPVDAALATDPQRFKEFLRQVVACPRNEFSQV